jgi:DNA invertase Pin-like site-specific DNA recombinase
MKQGQANGAVVYVRVSTDEQANGPPQPVKSGAAGSRLLRTECLEVIRVFIDPGESARSTDRPAFQEMLTFCRANRHKIACIVVQDLSRFARNLQDQMRTLYELNAVNIVLRSVYESNIDESPEGKMQAGIFGTFNEYFSNSLSIGFAQGRNKKYPRYRCRKSGWRAVKLAAQELETEFLGLLQQLTPVQKTISEFRKIAARAWTEKQGDTQKRITRLTARLEEQKKLRKELRNKFLSGSFSDNEYNEAKADYDAEIAVMEDELRILNLSVMRWMCSCVLPSCF